MGVSAGVRMSQSRALQKSARQEVRRSGGFAQAPHRSEVLFEKGLVVTMHFIDISSIPTPASVGHSGGSEVQAWSSGRAQAGKPISCERTCASPR